MYETPSLNMNEVMYLKKFKWNKTTDPPFPKKIKGEKKQVKINFYYGDKPLGAIPPDFKSSFEG